MFYLLVHTNSHTHAIDDCNHRAAGPGCTSNNMKRKCCYLGNKGETHIKSQRRCDLSDWIYCYNDYFTINISCQNKVSVVAFKLCVNRIANKVIIIPVIIRVPDRETYLYHGLHSVCDI